MKRLNELITAIEKGEMLSYEEISPYCKSLYTYLKDYYCDEPMFMITLVTNAIQAGKIVPANEFTETVYSEINDGVLITEDEMNEDQFMEFETINFNSMFLKDLL